MENWKRSIGLRIKRLREARGLTQEGLAEHSGISSRSVSNIERGMNFPSFESLISFVGILKCNLSDILDAPAKGAAGTRVDSEAKLSAIIKSLPNDKIEIAIKFMSSLT